MSITGIPELKESYRKLGPRNFWLTMSGTIAFIILGAWLSMTAQWAGQCDHSGRGLVGLVKELRCSPDLLVGGPVEIGLFIWIWSMPAIVVGCLAWAIIRKIRTSSKSSSFQDFSE
jgi:hypothetical protein